MGSISEPTEIKEKDSVGKEFIEWAEKYWHLESLVKMDHPDTFAGEACNYKYLRNVFVAKINSIIKERL